MVVLMPDAVDTVTLAPGDGWRYHPKHVERFTDINKLYIVASCWTINGTMAIMTDSSNNLLHSRVTFVSTRTEFSQFK